MNVTRENWLQLAGTLEKGEYLMLNPRGDLTIEEAKAALIAQYGKSRVWMVATHGQPMYIINGYSNIGIKIRYAPTDAILKKVKEYEAEVDATNG